MACKSIYIDPDVVESMASKGNSVSDIAAILGCGPSIINDNYSEAYQRGRSNLRMSIVKKQLEKALEEGDTRMLIHLGKVICDQKEVNQLEHSGEVPISVQYWGEKAKKFKEESTEQDDEPDQDT